MSQRATRSGDSRAAAPAEQARSKGVSPPATGTRLPASMPAGVTGTVAYVQHMQALAGNQAVQGLLGGHGAPPLPPRAPSRQIAHIGIQRTYTGGRAVQREGGAGHAEAGQSGPTTVADGPEWTATGNQVLVHQLTGAIVRDQPLPEQDGSTAVAHLTQNTRVLSLRHNPTARWHAVRVLDGEHAGASGYVADWLVRDDAPDADAVIYDVQGDDQLRTIVQNHRQYASYPIVTGDDARSLVMAVWVANRDGGGVRLVGDSDGGLFDRTLDTLDDYRAVTRRIYQTIELVGGQQIWLPGVAYVNALKAAGTIPQRAGWKNAAIETGKRITGLQLGLTEGLIGSVVDLLTGIFDLAKGVVDLIISTLTGEVFGAIGEMIDFLATLVEEGQVLQFAKDVAAGLVHSVIETGKEFFAKWKEPPVFDAWRFRGKIVGYILAEVLMAVLSGGLSALKWLDKLGDVGKIAKRVASSAKSKIDDLPIPGRRKGAAVPDGNAGRRFDGDDKLDPKRLAVVLKARALAEVHDSADTPVAMAVASLNAAFKPGNPWINEFSAHPKGEPGHYRIIMRTPVDIDRNYTAPEHTSNRLGGPTKADLLRLKKKYHIDSDSEAAALWHVEMQSSTRSVIAGEAAIKRSLGIDPSKPGVKMTDLMKTEQNGLKVPIEVKNQKEIHLSGPGNAALSKFEEIARVGKMEQVSHFEIIANIESKLPPNFKVDVDGNLHRLISGTTTWEKVLIGGKDVRVRRGGLGEISK